MYSLLMVIGAVVGAAGAVSVACVCSPRSSLMIQRRESIDERVIASASSIG